MVDTSREVYVKAPHGYRRSRGLRWKWGKSFLRLLARSCRNRRLKPAHWTFFCALYYAARYSLCRDRNFCESNLEIFAVMDAG